VVSGLDHDDLFGTVGLCEVDEVEEGALGEFVDGDVAEPDEECLLLFFKETREAAVGLRAIQTDL